MRRECRERFPPPPISKETASKRSRHASRHVRDARAVMHVGIACLRWRGKRSRHSRRMRIRKFAYLARGPWQAMLIGVVNTTICVRYKRVYIYFPISTLSDSLNKIQLSIITPMIKVSLSVLGPIKFNISWVFKYLRLRNNASVGARPPQGLKQSWGTRQHCERIDASKNQQSRRGDNTWKSVQKPLG